MAKITDTLTQMIEPIVTSMSYEFVGLEFIAQGNNSVLRIFIDLPDGINVDDCAAVSRQVSALLDVEDPISSEYNLEVSSPGLDRPLFKLEHYQRFVGSIAKIRVFVAVNGRKNFRGTIEGTENNEVILSVDGERWFLDVDNIDKARIVPVF